MTVACAREGIFSNSNNRLRELVATLRGIKIRG